jgi:hypothetical protein
MAIAYDSKSNLGGGASLGTGATLTVSQTCTGSDRYIVAAVALSISAGVPSGTCTYHGVSMDLLGMKQETTNGETIFLFGLENPDTGGSYDCVFTNGPTYASSYTAMGSVSYTGVHQTTSTGTFVSDSNISSTPATVTATSASGELVVGAACFSGSGTTGGGQTERFNDNNNAGINVSDEAGAASVVMSVSFAGGEAWAIAAVPLKPAGGGGGGGDGFMWLA